MEALETYRGSVPPRAVVDGLRARPLAGPGDLTIVESSKSR
jgi:hypothetical protein